MATEAHLDDGVAHQLRQDRRPIGGERRPPLASNHRVLGYRAKQAAQVRRTTAALLKSNDEKNNNKYITTTTTTVFCKSFRRKIAQNNTTDLKDCKCLSHHFLC